MDYVFVYNKQILFKQLHDNEETRIFNVNRLSSSGLLFTFIRVPNI